MAGSRNCSPAGCPRSGGFAGSGAIMPDLAVRSDVSLAPGDPELRHLDVDAPTGDGTVTYQALVGLVTQLEPDLGPAAIGTLSDGRIATTPPSTQS
jgi:Maltokinase N-terminal cap domain